ncbi:hypothetical protein PhaeoP72_02284 [Phaeobacter inhibens]|uniref:hypothetical protein n=1 Tax=Phaeobacter inhibens TaxID=221822 RepID=UPI000C9C195E|nr:hypothetical protein [Phaeobacter inhibens]AUR04245.1 hypothetical protein PhaeoP72_02284 [Phaeobacter inhibens]
MISSVSVTVGKKTHKLKCSTLAMAALEEARGENFDVILNQLIAGNRGVKVIIAAWAAFLNDGKGVPIEDAAGVLDDLGGYAAAAPYLAQALNRAFPMLQLKTDADDGEDESAEDGGDEGNEVPPVE